jgi:hypothetical protein
VCANYLARARMEGLAISIGVPIAVTSSLSQWELYSKVLIFL